MKWSMQWTDRIGRRLKLRDVHILLVVVECGSMARAAKQLSISQPVVSKAISDLEHAFGVRLLERSRQGIDVTPYGRALLESGVAAFDELRRGVQKIEFLSDATAGEVRIGATEPMSMGLLPVVINRLVRRYPRLSVDVVQAPTTDVLHRELRERTVDFVVGRVATGASESDMSVELLFNEPILVVAGSQSDWARAATDRTSRLEECAMGASETRYPGKHPHRRMVSSMPPRVPRWSRHLQFYPAAECFDRHRGIPHSAPALPVALRQQAASH
jgi:DNA-binding transcriptional LysR family regulator